MKSPEVSVVMSCFDAEKTIDRAVESVINQSYSDFEFIIINDGSNDRTLDKVSGHAKRDKRIRLFTNKKNLGLAGSLNKGIGLAKGRYIARMDADDESLPHRFERQIDFLSRFPEIDVLGTGVIAQNTKGEDLGTLILPKTHKEIVRRVFRKTMVLHPTVFIKKEIFTSKGWWYDSELRWAEDADLWYRIHDQVRFANLSEPLLKYTTKDKLSFRHAKGNFMVKMKNLKRRGVLSKYWPQLLYDVVVLMKKMVVAN